MRLINGDALRRKVKRESNPYGKPSIDFESGKRVIELIDSQPTVQFEIIRCKDCKTWQNDYAPNYHYCPMIDGTHRNDFYCADAERRETNAKLD